MLDRSPLWPARRPLWGTCLTVGVLGVFVGVALLAVPGASRAPLYVFLTETIPLTAYAAGWIIGGALTVTALLAGHWSLRWIVLGYGCGQAGWAFAVLLYALQDGGGLGLVTAGAMSALAVVTWLSAPAVSSVH